MGGVAYAVFSVNGRITRNRYQTRRNVHSLEMQIDVDSITLTLILTLTLTLTLTLDLLNLESIGFVKDYYCAKFQAIYDHGFSFYRANIHPTPPTPSPHTQCHTYITNIYIIYINVKNLSV